MNQQIVCRRRAEETLFPFLKERGVRKFLLVCDAAFPHLRMAAPIASGPVPCAVFQGFSSNPKYEDVLRGVEAFRAENCDAVVAVGGGSSLDVGKCIKLFARMDPEQDCLAQPLQENGVPLVAVPTTAGTGSEVTLVAVVADTHKHAKLSFTSYKLVPHVAILDPALTSSLPPKLTATTGMDALTHAVEAHTSIQKNPVSDAFAAKAVELIAANLPTACRNGADTEARTSLALASLMAGAAFSNAMVGIVHAIGHSLGGLCRIPHGQAMMMLLPHCVRFNLDRGIHAGLYGQLLDVLAPARAAALGAGAAPEALDRAFLDELTALNDLFHREYGVPLTLSELGVSRDDLPAVAKQARYDGAALYNETEITLEDAMAVLEAAY